MDSTNNRGEKKNRPQGQEWEDAAFGWENMKDGIFENILAEDPQFFEEKRKRRVPVWLWAGAAVLLLCGLGFWVLIGDEEPIDHKSPAKAPIQKLSDEKRAIAIESEPSKSFKEKNNRPDEVSDDSKNSQPLRTNQIKNQPSLANAPLSYDGDTTLSETVLSNNISKIEIESTEKNKAFSQPKNLRQFTPSLLEVNINPIKINQSVPMLALSSVLTVSNSNINSGDENGKAEKGKWKIAAIGGSLLSPSKYSGSSAAAGLRNDNTSPYFGYQYGLDAWMPLAKNNYLFFGLNRQVIYQNIDIYTEREVEVLQENVLLEVTHYIVGGRTSEVYGDTLMTHTQKNRLVHYNEFKSVQAEVGFAKIFSLDKWNFNPYAGVATGLLTHQEGRTVAADKSIFEFNKGHAIYKQFQFKTWAGLEVERMLSEKLSLLLRYRFDKQWNNASIESNLMLRPTYHYLSLGISKRL